jgi:hypothetical protein
MPLPDSESPEKSLGDCAICMDTIVLDTTAHRRSKSADERREQGIVNTGGSLLNAVQIGVNASGAKKNYSLAPCHHLFVSYIWVCIVYSLTDLALQHTECLERVCRTYSSFPFFPHKLIDVISRIVARYQSEIHQPLILSHH